MQTLLAHKSLHESIKKLFGFFSEHIEDVARQKAEQLLKEAPRAEMDLLAACERYERTEKRREYRNGYYVRQLISHHELLKVRVPRLRASKRLQQVGFPSVLNQPLTGRVL